PRLVLRHGPGFRRCVAAVPDHLRLDTAAFLVPCLVSSRGVRARGRADASSHAWETLHAAQHPDLHDHPGGNLPDALRFGHERMDLSAVRAFPERGVPSLCGQALCPVQRSTGAAHVSLFDHLPLLHVCRAARRSLLARGVGALPGTPKMDNVRSKSRLENRMLTTQVPVGEASDVQATALKLWFEY